MDSAKAVLDKCALLRADSARKNLVIGDDIDSFLSGALYLKHNPNTEVIGFYQGYSRLHLSPGFADVDATTLWLDLDIYHARCRSLGHHIVRKSRKDELPGFSNSCNLNELRGMYAGNFARKYPLGTIHFLMTLYGETYSPGSDAELLIWLADSTYINGQSHRYRENVNDWIQNFLQARFLEATFESIDTLDFEKRMAGFYERLGARGFRQGKGQVSSKHLGLSGYQFQGSYQDEDYLQRTASLVAEVTGWPDISKHHRHEAHAIQGTRRSGSLRQILGDRTLDQFLDENRVFSFVIPNGGRINYTTDIEV